MTVAVAVAAERVAARAAVWGLAAAAGRWW